MSRHLAEDSAREIDQKDIKQSAFTQNESELRPLVETFLDLLARGQEEHGGRETMVGRKERKRVGEVQLTIFCER